MSDNPQPSENDELLFFSILCVGVDPTFLSQLYSIEELSDASIDLSRNIKDAERKLSHQLYDLYFIEPLPNEGETFALVKLIKAQTKNKHYITIIANSLQEREHFSLLEHSKTIDTILSKPIDIQTLKKTFANIKNKFFSSPTPSSFDVKLKELKDSYDKSIPEKVNQLITLVHLLQNKFSMEALYELKDAVHKIKGTAGSFGYQEVTNICKDLQEDIVTHLNKEQEFTPEWTLSLNDFIKNIKKEFYPKELSKVEEKKSPLFPNKIPLVYVIDMDTKFLEHLNQLKEFYSIELKTFSDPTHAMHLLKKEAADAIFSSSKFPGYHLTGYQLLNACPPGITHKKLLTGLFINQDDLKERMHAIEQGVDLIFKRPFSAQSLLQTTEDSFNSSKPHKYKVLVLDDDLDFCHLVIVVLAKINIEVRAIQTSEELFVAIEEFKPDLLLLDLVLPKYDGFNLLKTLRHDANFQSLPIIIVTGKDEASVRVEAYAAKADDILFKPITMELLQKRILSFLERQDYKQEQKQDLHSIKSTQRSHKELIKKLYILLHQQDETSFLVLFEIVPKKTVSKELILQREDTEAFFSKALLEEKEISLEFYPYEENLYSLVFEKTNFETTRFKILELLEAWCLDELEKHEKVRAIIIPTSQGLDKTPEELLSLTEKELEKTKIPENDKIQILSFSKDSSVFHIREVVIIDPDEELIKVLKMAFENRGYHVRSFQMGKEALEYLENVNNTASLVITERKLVDMDGIVILKRLKKNKESSPPLFILSYYSSDKDICEGLEEGADEYIAKPFNTALLIQKAIKAMEEE